MKELKITGVSQDNDFENEDEVLYYLVVNKGELRIPISADAAHETLVFFHSSKNGKSGIQVEEEDSPDPYEEPESRGVSDDSVVDEDGVGQV